MVVKTCPQALQRFFSDIFPSVPDDIPAPTLGPGHVPPTVDEAPPANRCFVYEKQRGELPICRLEVKFPKQTEVFYLRHMLLNYPKLSFADCTVHNSKTFATHEEAMVATGYFAASGEPSRVLSELVQLRYTPAQLRFAFLAWHFSNKMRVPSHCTRNLKRS